MQTIIEKHFKFNYRTMVKRVKYRTNNNEADAEDVVMEAYTRALKYKDTFEMGSPFNNWFGRIVSNSLKDWKAEQFNHSISEEFDEQEIEPIPDFKLESQLLEIIHQHIQGLKNEQIKEILCLYFTHGFKTREVSQISDVNYNTVHSVIKRFKQSMKEAHA